MTRNRDGRLIGNRHVARVADGATPSTPTVAHAHRHCQSGAPLGLPIATAPCMKMDADSSTAHHHLAVSCACCLRDRIVVALHSEGEEQAGRASKGALPTCHRVHLSTRECSGRSHRAVKAPPSGLCTALADDPRGAHALDLCRSSWWLQRLSVKRLCWMRSAACHPAHAEAGRVRAEAVCAFSTLSSHILTQRAKQCAHGLGKITKTRSVPRSLGSTRVIRGQGRVV